MRILQFKAKGQMLKKFGEFSNIIRGSKKYLKCEFDFDDEWNVYFIKIAVFEISDNEYAVPIDRTNTCFVPDQVTDYACFKLHVVGVTRDKTAKIVTNKELITQGE